MVDFASALVERELDSNSRDFNMRGSMINVNSSVRREWAKPTVRRIVAGSAEAGGAAGPDGTIGQS